ncbi:MAG: BatA domain-containing protein, partial [Acidimicrobiia bacterium]
MGFGLPPALLGLLVVPLLAAGYVLQLRRSRRSAVRYPHVALLRAVAPAGSRWRRHIPAGLLLAAVAVLAVGAGRPELTTTVPVARTSIILALDVSRSMCATDVEPNRLTVAQE